MKLTTYLDFLNMISSLEGLQDNKCNNPAGASKQRKTDKPNIAYMQREWSTENRKPVKKTHIKKTVHWLQETSLLQLDDQREVLLQ